MSKKLIVAGKATALVAWCWIAMMIAVAIASTISAVSGKITIGGFIVYLVAGLLVAPVVKMLWPKTKTTKENNNV